MMLLEDERISIRSLTIDDFRPGGEFDFLDIYMKYKDKNTNILKEVHFVVAIKVRGSDRGVGYFYGEEGTPEDMMKPADVILDRLAKEVHRIMYWRNWEFINKEDDGTHIWYNYKAVK